MNSHEHFAEAERLAESMMGVDMCSDAISAVAAVAQVHAILALVAAVYEADA